MQTEIYFKIFNTPNSLKNWDSHIEFAMSQSEIVSESKEKWIESLNFLKMELGQKFLSVSGINHPLAELVKGKASWQVSEVISIVNTLKNLKYNNSNYLKLIHRLRGNNISRTEGVFFLEAARMFSGAGFNISFLQEDKLKKTPDIKLINPSNSEKIFVEISGLNDSLDREKLNANYKALYEVLENPEEWMPYSCFQKRYLNERELNNVIALIIDKKNEAAKNNIIISYEDDKIQISISNISKYDDLMKFIELNNHRKGLRGAPLNFDETERLCSNKLQKKVAQLPKDSAGILFMVVNSLYFMVKDTNDIITRFSERMQNHKNLLGVILYASDLDIGESEVFTNEHAVLNIKRVEGVFTKYILFIKNKLCDINLDKDSIERIYSALN